MSGAEKHPEQLDVEIDPARSEPTRKVVPETNQVVFVNIRQVLVCPFPKKTDKEQNNLLVGTVGRICRFRFLLGQPISGISLKGRGWHRFTIELAVKVSESFAQSLSALLL